MDVAGSLEQNLPPNLKGLAAPIAGALRQPTTRTVNRLLAAPRVQQLWVEANGRAHQKLINVLENKTGSGIDTGNGTVTLDLSEVLTELGVNLGLPPAALEKLPPDAGVVTIMSSDQLSAAQTAVQVIRFLSTWLLVLMLALFALAIYLARGQRRETLRNVGFTFMLLGLLALVVRHVAGDYVVTTLTTPQSERAGDHVWIISTSILGDIGWALILYGVVAVIGTVLAGPMSYAVSARRWAAPVMNDRPGVVWGVAASAYLLLILWGGTHALRTWWGILLLGRTAGGRRGRAATGEPARVSGRRRNRRLGAGARACHGTRRSFSRHGDRQASRPAGLGCDHRSRVRARQAARSELLEP